MSLRKMINVTLRQKKLKNGNFSLYLDFYPAIIKDGVKSRRIFLKEYLFPEFQILDNGKHKKNLENIERNKQVQFLARSMRERYYNEYNKPEIYSELEKVAIDERLRQQSDFVEFLVCHINQKNPKDKKVWNGFKKYLLDFLAVEKNISKISFCDLNYDFSESFKIFLQEKTNLSQNSAASYFSKFVAILKIAHGQDYIKSNWPFRLKSIKENYGIKDILTKDELQKLYEKDCSKPTIKRAALFSAYTGLRFSDLVNLKWNNIIVEKNCMSIKIIQEKTENEVIIPLNEIAQQQLGVYGTDLNRKVFEGLSYTTHTNRELKFWIQSAGIQKKITFHSFRHTFGSLLASNHIPLNVIKNLMGHKTANSTIKYLQSENSENISAVNSLL